MSAFKEKVKKKLCINFVQEYIYTNIVLLFFQHFFIKFSLFFQFVETSLFNIPAKNKLYHLVMFISFCWVSVFVKNNCREKRARVAAAS